MNANDSKFLVFKTKQKPKQSNLNRLVTVLKGGPGSGHRGHSGRPGKRGGSSGGKGAGSSSAAVANGSIVATASSNAHGNNGYMIVNDVVYKMDQKLNQFGQEEYLHGDFIKDNRDLFGLSDVKTTDDSEALIAKVLDNGGVRIRMYGGEAAIQTKNVDTATLQKLQKLHDDGKLDLSTFGVFHTWDTQYVAGKPYTRVEFEYEDFLDAKYVVDGKLKEGKRQ